MICLLFALNHLNDLFCCFQLSYIMGVHFVGPDISSAMQVSMHGGCVCVCDVYLLCVATHCHLDCYCRHFVLCGEGAFLHRG